MPLTWYLLPKCLLNAWYIAGFYLYPSDYNFIVINNFLSVILFNYLPNFMFLAFKLCLHMKKYFLNLEILFFYFNKIFLQNSIIITHLVVGFLTPKGEDCNYSP